jgi:hypothetical protein
MPSAIHPHQFPQPPESAFKHEATFTGRLPGQGETDITDMTVGSRWFVDSPRDRARLFKYAEAEAYLDPDNHLQLFQRTLSRADTGALVGNSSGFTPPETWVPLDLPGMLSRLMRHYTFGGQHGFRLVPEDDGADPAVINRLVRENKLDLLFRQAAGELPVTGDAVFRVSLKDVPREDGEEGTEPHAVIRYVKPSHYTPKLSMFDATDVEQVTLAWVFPLEQFESEAARAQKVKGEREMVVLREIHTPAEGDQATGIIEYKVNHWDGKKLGDELPLGQFFPDLDPEQDSLVHGIGVVHLGYNVRAGEHWGRSEVLRARRLILALDNRLSQEDEVLEKHARPKLIVGPGVLDANARVNLADFDVIEIAPDILEKAIKPEYLTWDMQVSAIQHEIEKLEEYLFMTTETSPASFGLERDGSQVESARALRFKAHRTVNKVEDLRVAFDCAIRDLFELAQEMELRAREEDNLDAFDPVRVRADWPDPIIEDQTQEVTDWSTLKGSGLSSRRRAVMDLYNLPPEEAEAEVREILQDQVDEGAASASPTAPPPSPFGAEAAPPAGTPGGTSLPAQVPEEGPGPEEV